MPENRSPWISQLDATRPQQKLERDIETDVAIVGAGIAGISTAFFVLKYTDKSVTILEQGKLAHGATGHNAGQVVSYFERGFASLVEEFGLEKAAAGQRAIENAWDLIEEMYGDGGLDILLSRFTGHAGLSTLDQVLFHLRNNAGRVAAGLPAERMLVSEAAPFLSQIPDEYASLYQVSPQPEILNLLETGAESYVAVLSYEKGILNSALFCQEIVAFLKSTYGSRFALYEHTPIPKLLLRNEHTVLDAIENTVTAKRVVLATNGFEGFHIINESGLEIDHRFHHMVDGWVGYMSAYLEPSGRLPAAISYFDKPKHDEDVTYFYMTRRPHEQSGSAQNLIAVGGPETYLEESRTYAMSDAFPEGVLEEIDTFIKGAYGTNPNQSGGYAFTWHGLMGYTRNSVRLVGIEPKNPVLIYNLGCNGVGILPSIYGGRRVADIVGGVEIEPSIFDVPEPS